MTFKGASDQRTVAPHIEHLNAAGYLDTQTKRRQTTLRLTLLGLDRLTEHVPALQIVTNAAAELLGARRSTCSRLLTDAERRPVDSL